MRSLPRTRTIAWPAIVACCAALCFAHGAQADVIVLKNGRRVTASNVKEAGDRFSGETPAGMITLPASMVDHVERTAAGGGSVSDPTTESSSPAASLRWERPSSGNGSGRERTESPDPAQLRQLRQAAAGGDTAAAARAAAIESATAELEFARGNLDEALIHADRALSYDPASARLLIDAAYFRLRHGEYGAALEHLQRARKTAPESQDVAKLMGWAYYGLNRMAPAVEEWTRAQNIHPDPDVAAALSKAERDLEAEREFREDGSEHFVLKYDGTSAPELARAILRELESDMQSISATLNYSPAERIGVLLYTNEAFADITHAPSWIGALNDGRIRIPVQGLSAVTPDLARVLKHELAHSLIGGKTQGRCPVWLQEGVAQWIDGSQTTSGTAAKLLAQYDQHEEPSLTLLESSWMNFDSEFAGNAYGWSLAVVESVVRAGGPGDIERLLQRVALDANTETAVHSSLHLDYDGLVRFAADYLRKSYTR